MKCRMKLITVGFHFGLFALMISAHSNNAFRLDKNFNVICRKSNSELKLKTRSKLGKAIFHSSLTFKILAMTLDVVSQVSQWNRN